MLSCIWVNSYRKPVLSELTHVRHFVIFYHLVPNSRETNADQEIFESFFAVLTCQSVSSASTQWSKKQVPRRIQYVCSPL